MAADLGAMADALGQHLDRRFGRDGHVCQRLERLSGGASRETFAFELVRPDRPGAPWPLILQRVRAGALSAAFSMEGEAALLRAAAEIGVPVAPVVDGCDDAAVIGAPFVVMERVEGETIARRILRDDDFVEARSLIVAQAAAALARIHTLPADAGPHLRADEPVHQLRGLLDMMGEPHPAFELAFRWLEEHRPTAADTAPRVVHGDFRLGNLIVGPEGLRAVLDWELAHLGDPIEDLGWFCVRAWRFGAAPPVAGLGTYDELLDAYAAAGGVPVDREALRWWEVLGTLRWGIICILQASGHLSGASRSVELAAIGRRVCENEYDVLRLIDPASTSAPFDAVGTTGGEEVGGYDPGPHGAPTAGQLVEAVREFLERDVLDATDGRVHFHARVAVNALRMVERELQVGSEMAARHHDRLATLGCATDEELAAAIREGALDERTDEVTAAVYASVCDKLRVANPGYAADD